MIAVSDMTPTDLAGYVGSHLERQGVNVVLSGGSCVTYYSNGKYVSMDLDFVNAGFARRQVIEVAMAQIGFVQRNRYFKHPDNEYLVEFPPGPLGVGDGQVGEIVDIETAAGTFRAISPTDCVKDRLAGYYHWDDLQCLEQARWVAQANDVDLEEIARWSGREGKAEVFAEIRPTLQRIPR